MRKEIICFLLNSQTSNYLVTFKVTISSQKMNVKITYDQSILCSYKLED